MKFVLQPWQLMLIILASWVTREQQQRIDYLETQCDVFREHIGKKRILLTDDQAWPIPVCSSDSGSRAATTGDQRWSRSLC